VRASPSEVFDFVIDLERCHVGRKQAVAGCRQPDHCSRAPETANRSPSGARNHNRSLTLLLPRRSACALASSGVEKTAAS
jgi:hypothetical protein